MDIKIERNGDITLLKCIGSLDAENVVFFRKKTGELFDGGSSRFVIDANKLSFVDSMGLGAMISLMRRVREKKGDVKVFGLNAEVKEIFDITRLNKLFDVCASFEAACKKF